MEQLNEKIKNVNLVPVIKVDLIRGDGSKKNPIRKVSQYWDLSGNLINDDNGNHDFDEASTTLLASSDINSNDIK